MIYVDECIDATMQYLKAPKQNLKRCVYNLGGLSIYPEDFIQEVQKLIPGLTFEYELCPTRSPIADSWPRKLDDTFAQEEWGLNYNVTVGDLAYKILDNIDPKYKKDRVLNMEQSPITESQKAKRTTKQF